MRSSSLAGQDGTRIAHSLASCSLARSLSEEVDEYHVKRADSVGPFPNVGVAQKMQPTKKLLSVFGGFERRRSVDKKNDKKNEGVGDALQSSIDLKKSGTFSALVEGGVGDDDSPLIKAKRGQADAEEVAAKPDIADIDAQHPLRRTGTTLSQMTTHDDANGGGVKSRVLVEKKESTAVSLVGGQANASSVDVDVSSLKRTFSESNEAGIGGVESECWYTTSTEEMCADSNALARDADVRRRMIALETSMVSLNEKVHECMVAALKMDHVVHTIHRMASDATKAQIDTEFRLAGLVESICMDSSLAEQLAELDGRVRGLTRDLSRLEDDWEQEQEEKVVQMEEEEARGARTERVGAALAFVTQHIVVPFVLSLLFRRSGK